MPMDQRKLNRHGRQQARQIGRVCRRDQCPSNGRDRDSRGETEYPSLWNPTAAECARYWLETYPADTHSRLEPSIWQDYPGSLS